MADQSHPRQSRQPWWCEACGSRSYVDHDEHAGVWEVYKQISDDHRRHDAQCHADHGLGVVRVQNEGWVTSLAS